MEAHKQSIISATRKSMEVNITTQSSAEAIQSGKEVGSWRGAGVAAAVTATNHRTRHEFLSIFHLLL